MRRGATAVALALGVLSVTSCGLVGGMTLPSNPSWRGGCSIGVGLDATLHGSASDARVTWATDNGSARRIELLWPVGYTARLNPRLEVLDERGSVVAREGDQVIGGCLSGPGDNPVARVDADQVRPPGWQPGDG